MTGVLFNHESIYRDEKYISRLITRSAAKIKLGDKKEIKVKNPFSRADWGSAKDFTQAFFKMLNADTPEDYIVSSGIEHSVSDIINIAFDSLNLDISKFLLYPNNAKEPELSILGDSSKLSKKLNWEQKEEFKPLILNMVEHDLLAKTSEDSRENFKGGYDFEEAFRKPFLPPHAPDESPVSGQRNVTPLSGEESDRSGQPSEPGVSDKQ